MVYEVTCGRECDINKSYVFKRFFLQNSSAVNCAIHEHHILKCIAKKVIKSPFLGTLYYSFLHEGSPVLILNQRSEFDLSDVIHNFGPLSENEVIYYCSEIISGIVHIHNMGIVRLDIQKENVLLSNTGHAIISNFDCAYDLIYNSEPLSLNDNRGTLYYMAPEIARGRCIRFMTDTWGVGAVMACLLADEFR